MGPMGPGAQVTLHQASPGTPRKSVTLKVEPEEQDSATKFLTIPKTIAVSSSSETLTGKFILINTFCFIMMYSKVHIELELLYLNRTSVC